MSTLTRKQAYRGQHVQVNLTDGRTLTGAINGWGAQVIQIVPDANAKANGWNRSRHDIHRAQVESVIAL